MSEKDDVIDGCLGLLFIVPFNCLRIAFYIAGLIWIYRHWY